MKRILRIAALAAAAAACVVPASADIDLSYYQSINGKKGRDLKNAVHTLIANNVKMLSYGSGNNGTWWGFYVTDQTDDGKVIDRYSNDVRSFGSRGSAVGGMNIEHSFPKSWWGGTKNNAYKDLFNLMPCEQKINSSKSNYGMGAVSDVSTDNGCTKVGKGAAGSRTINLWEPADKWKGDFARGYMYMATAYQDFSWTSEGENSLSDGSYPTLKEWAYTLYMKWAKQDPVSEIEIDRNDDVKSLQGNRNPFVDFPNLMEYIWGDSTDIAFNVATTLKSTQHQGTVDPVDPDNPSTADEVTLFENSLLDDPAGFEVENIYCPDDITVWNNTKKYGWSASGYVSSSKTKYETDAILWSPVLDLTEYSSVKFEMEHAVNFCSNPSDVLSVIYRIEECEPESGADTGYITAEGLSWPEGNGWDFMKTHSSTDKVAGHKVRLGFRYTSTTDEAGTWEIKNLKITAVKKSSGIIELPGDLYMPDTDYEVKPEYYTIDGRRLDDVSSYSGLLIIRRGSTVSKVYVR